MTDFTKQLSWVVLSTVLVACGGGDSSSTTTQNPTQSDSSPSSPSAEPSPDSTSEPATPSTQTPVAPTTPATVVPDPIGPAGEPSMTVTQTIYNNQLPADVQLDSRGFPILNSLPSAKGQVYIDFDGHGDFYKPIDFDGYPNHFNARERQYIYEWWTTVAAHFSMFDINVTTVLDETKPHTWNLISPQAKLGVAWGGYGLANRPVAEMTSRHGPYASVVGHEGGHTFGLPHVIGLDSQGNMTQAYYGSPYPLRGWHMGAGDRIVNKWSNKFHWARQQQYFGEIEQIVSRIVSNDAESMGYRPDDHNTALSAASEMPRKENSTNSFRAKGVLETMSDVDSFYFDWQGGDALISNHAFELSPVNAKLTLLNSAEQVIGQVNNGENHQFLSANLPTGRYYVQLETAGRYSDLGEYRLRVESVNASWRVSNFGPKRLIGQTSYDVATNQWTLQSTGGDLWNSNDNVIFNHQTLHGAGEIIARVDSYDATHPWAKAGVMIRAGLTADAAHVSQIATIGNGQRTHHRNINGERTYDRSANTADNKWVRVTRSQSNDDAGQPTGKYDLFTTYTSADGTHWTQVHQLIVDMPDEVYIGLVQSTQHQNIMAKAVFSHVTVTGNTQRMQTTQLTAPQQLRVTKNAAEQVALSWQAIAEAAGYVVERSHDGQSYHEIAKVGSTTFVDTTAQGGVPYSYRVRALDAVGAASARSSALAVQVRASAVLDLAAVSFNDTTILLDWGEPLGQRGYQIERASNGGAFEVVAQKHADYTENAKNNNFANTQKYVDDSLTAGANYTYRVTTWDEQGLAGVAMIQSVTKLAQPAITQANTTSNSVQLSWQSIVQAESYVLEASSDGGTTWAETPLGADITNYTASGLTAATDYRFRLRAIATGKNSAWSNALQVITLADNPARAPWSVSNLGNAESVVQATNSGFRIFVKSSDVWGRRDNFVYVSQPASDDVDIRVQVVSQTNTSRWAKAGIMLRASNAANAAHVSVVMTPGNGVATQWRTQTNAGSQNTNTGGLNAPYWLRLTRKGNEITTYYSENGSSWTEQQSLTIDMGSAALIGLSNTSNNGAGSYNQVEFANVTLTK